MKYQPVRQNNELKMMIVGFKKEEFVQKSERSNGKDCMLLI